MRIETENRLSTPLAARAPTGEDQRISRQKRDDDQPRLAENNQEENGIGPGTILRDQFDEVLVEVKD
jgi:hypothetical protein